MIYCYAFNLNYSTLDEKPCKFASYGSLYNKNTIEDFKDCNKLELLNNEGTKIWNSIVSGEFLKNPSLLSRFLLLSFAVSIIIQEYRL